MYGSEKPRKGDIKIKRYSLTEGFPSPPKALPPTAARPVNVDGRLKGSVNEMGKEETVVKDMPVRNTGVLFAGNVTDSLLHLDSPAGLCKGIPVLGLRHWVSKSPRGFIFQSVRLCMIPALHWG